MECGWVSAPHSEDKTQRGSDGEVRLAPPFAYRIFEKLFPYYLSIGMTYDQYWKGDCELVKAYQEADNLSMVRKNQELWAQGMYTYHAVSKAMAGEPYLKEPLPMDFSKKDKAQSEEDRKKAEEKNQMMQTRDYVASFVAQYNKQRKDVENG